MAVCALCACFGIDPVLADDVCNRCPVGGNCTRSPVPTDPGVVIPVSLPGYWLYHRKADGTGAVCAELLELQGQCPPGTIETAGVCVPSTEVSSTWFECTTGLQLYKCARASACLGGATNVTSSVEASCEPGTTGPMCSVCALGWHRLEDGSCGVCDSSSDVTSGRMLRMIGIATLFCAAIAVVCMYASGHLETLCCACIRRVASKVAPKRAAAPAARRRCKCRSEKVKMLVGFMQVRSADAWCYIC